MREAGRTGRARETARNGIGPKLARLMLRLCGWRIAPFPDVARAVVVGGPHTSNWDAVIGFVGAAALGLNTAFLVKASAFRWWPLSSFLRHVGALPIDRSRATGVVEQAVGMLEHSERLLLVVTPEGTRTRARRWKTGFHHIARMAKVPIVLAVPNYARKELTFPLVIEPSTDLEADMRKIVDCFAATIPYHPGKLSAPVRTAREARHARKQRSQGGFRDVE